MSSDDGPQSEPAAIQSTVAGIKRMVLVGTLFAAVGYLLILGAQFLELTQFHPLLADYFSTYTQHSLAGGGPDRAGSAALNTALTSIHQFPSSLLWLKLGGIGHILVGIFIVLAGIVRALSLTPKRLSLQGSSRFRARELSAVRIRNASRYGPNTSEEVERSESVSSKWIRPSLSAPAAPRAPPSSRCGG